MSNLPAWKNVVSGGIPPSGSPLYYYSPAPSFGGGGGSGSVSYADTAGHASTADYATNAGNANTANTANSANTAISASYAVYAALAENSISASHATYAVLAQNAISASYSPFASTASYVPLTYGPGILYDPNYPMAFSASVRSVNGVFPVDGNISTALTGVTTGTSASLSISSSGNITGSINEGEVWVISNDPTSSNNGRSFIYDEDNTTGVGTWYELSPLDLSVTDARYLKLDAANGPMQGNINMGGYNITAGNLVGTSSWSEKAITASYVNITGSGVIVNYNGSQIQITGSAGGIIISSSVPGLREQGTLWFNSNDGNTYLQYLGPTGNTWIPAATSVGQAFSSSYAVTASRALTASYLDGTAPTVIHAKNISGQSIPNNIIPYTRVTNWTNTLAQNASEWNAAAGTFTAAKAGTYLVSTTLVFDQKAAALFGVQSTVAIRKNAVIQSQFANYVETGNAIYRGSVSATACVSLAAGEVLDIGAYQNLGSANTLTTFDGFCTVSIVEIASRITD